MSWPLYDVKYCRKINLSLQLYVISKMKKFKNMLYVSFLFASRSHSKTIVARIQNVNIRFVCTDLKNISEGRHSLLWSLEFEKITVERVKMFFCTDFLVNKSSSYDFALDWVTQTSGECVTLRFWIDVIPRLLFSRGSISPSQISESNLLINQLTRSFIRESLRVTREIILFFSLSITLQLSWRRLTRSLLWHDFPYSGAVRNSDIDMFVRLFQYSTRVPESHCLKLSLTETTVILIFTFVISFIIDDDITRQLQ